MTVRFSTWVDSLVPVTTLLSATDKIPVITDSPDTRAISRNDLARSVVASLLTTDGDLITRTGGDPARITRSGLASDSAFTSTFITQGTFSADEQLLTRTAGSVDVITRSGLAGDQAFVTRYVPYSLIDAKGDLVVGTADNILNVLPVGADSQVLTADSSSSTGVAWAPVSDSSKLPLTGGTLTGALNGTSASFATSVGAATFSGSDASISGEISAANYAVGVSALATSGAVTLNFSGTGYLTQTALTGNVTYAGSNYQEGVTVTVRVVNGGTQRVVAFPSNWVFLGVRPSAIAANRTAVLTVTSFGSNEASCVAAWAVQA